ncbi:MAG TPA: hypothetical protein VF458_04325 [Ktedonobacteraceae bacterium]
MSDEFVGMPDVQGRDARLGQWLYQLLAGAPPATSAEPIPVGEDVSLLGTDYHAAFYPAIPNFARALLQRDPEALTHYAPLFFHLIGCPTCHRAYLETYDALRAALSDDARPATTTLRFSSTASLATTSSKQLVFLCQLLIGQARSVLRQAHREHGDEDIWARALLQLAMQLSRHIMQGSLRQRALRDLVEVASLYQTSTTREIPERGEDTLTYSALVGAGNGVRGRTVRRAEMASRPQEQVSIELRSGNLEGTVTQEGDMLILRLSDLNISLRGKFLLISIPLGTLLEPVRWLGGNPYAIRSAGLVGPDGSLITPLGRTDLLLSNAEERNLLEILFKKLDVHPLEA